MGLLSKLFSDARNAMNSYVGDDTFLNGVASAAANVTAADGVVEDSEVDAAIKGMQANAIVSNSFNSTQISDAYGLALIRAKTRAGRMQNKRNIEALVGREATTRQDVFLIAADVAGEEIGPQEMAVLNDIAGLLNLDAKKLLG
ncbi:MULTISPECIES: Tellurite resistance protein TerB [unclassified Bradyrhizobium]|uniref:Tellurite resistance protein TerB n=1 Tax=unclassified Bradyrhizobium TaxID=2631580 RepID=UPI002915DF2F|nr:MULTISPECIES: Tellurite resistance protein TerB [unclassified Bradyrhizobium]